MAATIYVNGRITGEQDAVIPVLDHGFLYGEGVYEVMRTYNRKPFLYGPHMDRMRKSASMINLEVPYTDERDAVPDPGDGRGVLRGPGRRRPRDGDVHPRAADARRRAR